MNTTTTDTRSKRPIFRADTFLQEIAGLPVADQRREIVDRIASLDESMMLIDAQLKLARDKGKTTENNWFYRATRAITLLGHQKDLLTDGLVALRPTDTAFAERFVQVAKTRLDPDRFQELADEAAASRKDGAE